MENIYLGLAFFIFVLLLGILFLLVFISFRINSLELELKKVSRNFDDLVRENGCLFGTNNKALEGSSENYSMEIESLSRKCDKIVNILFEYHNLFVELDARLPK
ncbi:hypothetical protein [Streptococcus oralis]|jgi:hypothetical protein|uniref:hypothetical protein n=1 Tax=Streptococcus oralis TaxID=1303 RepID=UPI000A119FDD|nr:hypothetical protein [Streptococcus oralis]ORO81980.1 hypothetical protein B7704_06070 [Streptococcus oralis subsp. dentisani]